jgi:nickel-dependent lactate racemase
VTSPAPALLPAVIAELNRGGLRDEDICVVFALGTHQPHIEAERRQLAGEAIYRRVRYPLNQFAAPRIAVMPEGGSVVPRVARKESN